MAGDSHRGQLELGLWTVDFFFYNTSIFVACIVIGIVLEQVDAERLGRLQNGVQILKPRMYYLLRLL